MAYCKECRFYSGSDCSKFGRRAPIASCGNFVGFNEKPSKKYCKTCRFFNGRICSADGKEKAFISSCIRWAAFY